MRTIEARGGDTVRARLVVGRGHETPAAPAGARLEPLVVVYPGLREAVRAMFAVMFGTQ